MSQTRHTWRFLITTAMSVYMSCVKPVEASCDCGFVVKNSTSSTPTLYTDMFETDFLHLYDMPNSSTVSTNPSKGVGWQPQVYNVSAQAARGPYGKAAMLNNVVPNPIADHTKWSGPGIKGADPGLQIWARHAPTLAPSRYAQQNMIGMGEIVTSRTDFFYGSFRVGMKTTGLNGTCGSFFWFRNDMAEIDLEFLSSQTLLETTSGDTPSPNNANVSGQINLVLQTPESASQGFNAAQTPAFKLYTLPFSPSDDYHEYRFDWSEGRVDFFADGNHLWTLNQGVPSAPGALFLNHWSNGDPLWSGGPPKEDAVLTVSYVKAYFDSSNATRIQQWTKSCSHLALNLDQSMDSEWQMRNNRTCLVPDSANMDISPLGPNGNATGKTFFFTHVVPAAELGDQILYPAAMTSGTSIVSRHALSWLLPSCVVVVFTTLFSS